eukprot:TRINITY_DN28160_c0_g1_i2.p1 TRINITY_DN28160_c0_g1~~TRINITY_DN28160_c0_g1_i2.p1  ORF type:complete len:111 (-),score=38.39 TRINITY_DN28160_c0_g1_i2:89-421(-)
MVDLYFFFFFLMIRRPPRSTLSSSSAASDVYKRQVNKHVSLYPVSMTTTTGSSVCHHYRGPSYFIPPSLSPVPVSYTHLRAHETPEHLVCRLLLEKKKKIQILNSPHLRM